MEKKLPTDLENILIQIATHRARWMRVLGPVETEIEIWFTPKYWTAFLTMLHDYPEVGTISSSGEDYGAMIGGAKCYCIDGVPVSDRFTIRLRLT